VENNPDPAERYPVDLAFVSKESFVTDVTSRVQASRRLRSIASMIGAWSTQRSPMAATSVFGG